jgi:hypothetical protein
MKRRSVLTFAVPDVPRFTCQQVEGKHAREHRGSARERGYDNAWDRLSKWHLKREPLCRTCYWRGRKVAAVLTNHILPVRDRPDLRLEKGNLSSHCQTCHDTVVRELERVARDGGDLDVLKDWLSDPATWPEHMAFTAKAMPRLLRGK